MCIASGLLKPLIGYLTDQNGLEDFRRSLDSALQLQGLALLCTAIYQTFRNQLTLFHVICVLHLLSLLGIGLTARGKYGRTGAKRRIALWTLKIMIAGAFVAFLGYAWVTAPRFGSQPECNATTVYVIFFVSVDATSPVFRYLIMVLMILTVVAFLFGFLVAGLMGVVFCGVRRKDRVLQSSDIAAVIDVYARAQIKDKKAKRAELQSSLGEVISRTIINVYGVVMWSSRC